jgi:hypothetical protein
VSAALPPRPAISLGAGGALSVVADRHELRDFELCSLRWEQAALGDRAAEVSEC